MISRQDCRNGLKRLLLKKREILKHNVYQTCGKAMRSLEFHQANMLATKVLVEVKTRQSTIIQAFEILNQDVEYQ